VPSMTRHADTQKVAPIVGTTGGFTLIELIIVIALVGILSGVAVTSIKSTMPQNYLGGAARRTMTDLMLARMQAVSTNTAKTVSFTSSGYTIGTVTTNISSQFGGVTLSSTGSVTFTTVGMASAPITITFTGSGGLPPKYVDVSTAGRIRIR